MTVRSPVRAVLFDLFGTVVHFARGPNTTPLEWLHAVLERELPEVRSEAVLVALREVSDELVRARPPEYVEVPSRERFRRALVRAGVDSARAAAVAEPLSRV